MKIFYLLVLLNMLYLYLARLGKMCLLSRSTFNHLKNTLHGYGYHYDIKAHGLMMASIILALLAICLQFEIAWLSFLLLCILSLMLAPFILLWMATHRYHEHQFNDLTMLLQHMIALFKNSPKLYQTLKESRQYVSQQLRNEIDECMKILEESGDVHASLAYFLNLHPHFIVSNLFHLIETVELEGGELYDDGLDMIQEDIDDWIEDTYLFKQSQMKMKNRMLALSAMSLLIAFFAKNMMIEIQFDATSTLYQIAIFMFMVALLITITLAHQPLNQTWIDSSECIWNHSS